MRYTRNATFLYRQGQVIAANRDDGCWVKFSQECKNILDNAIEEDLSGTNLIDSFSSKEDKDYIRKLIQNLHKAGIVSEEKEEDEAQNLIETVDLSITNRCNLQCIHCAASADSRNGIDPLATQEWFEIIDKISECNPKLVTFTGGEPLVREDIFELLEYTSTHTSARITLMTNATLITNEVIARKIAMYCSSVDISIDGYDEETCSQIRGKGTFARVLKGIELLKKVGVKNITLSMVHTKITANDRRRFEEFCESLGVKAIVRRLSIVGRAVDHEDQLKIRYGDIWGCGKSRYTGVRLSIKADTRQTLSPVTVCVRFSTRHSPGAKCLPRLSLS